MLIAAVGVLNSAWFRLLRGQAGWFGLCFICFCPGSGDQFSRGPSDNLQLI
jgi:hypothetical protein